MKAFLTGVTGFMGRRLANALLERSPDCEIWALVRPRAEHGATPEGRPELGGLAQHPRVRLVSGDLCDPEGWRASVPGAFDAVLHLAAMTDFSESRRDATFRTNVDGTRNMLSFAHRLESLGRFWHVSTAYVCGTRSGTSPEALLGPAVAYANPYEESKHAAEALVAASGLPWVIVRPSILLGDSRTHEAESDKMVYGALKTYHRFLQVLRGKYTTEQIRALGQTPFRMQARPEVSKNCICLDDAVGLLAALMQARPDPGSVFHLTNPHPTTVAGLHAAVLRSLDLDCLALTAEEVSDPQAEEALLARGMGVYRPYLTNEEPVFAQDSLRAAIGDAAVDAVSPPTADLLERLFRAHVRTRLEPEIAIAPVDAGKGMAYRKKMLRRFGGGCLGYTTLKETFPVYLPGGKGYVSVRTKGRTVVMVADPVCPDDALDAAVTTFLDHARRHGLAPAAVQIGCATADALVRARGCATKMGDEAVVDVAAFDSRLLGKDYARLRWLRNCAIRNGIAVHELPRDTNPADALDEVSRAWLSRKVNKRELGLILRGLPTEPEPDTRIFQASHDGKQVGFVIFDPIHREGTVVGWIANHERYAPGPRGIHDLILLEAIRVLQSERCPLLSLGLAPLARLDKDQHPTASTVVRELLGRTLAEALTIYNFDGVAQHKTYYRPRWRPVYFWAPEAGVTDRMFDVFALIGLVAPEALRRLSPRAIETLTQAAE
jgi:nucleoside-diphosphate-sugar epimerase